MGNLCSTSSDKDAFSQPGRTLNSAPPAQASSSRPPKVGGPPRTLGSTGGSKSYGTTRGTEEERLEARRAAAQAAEARAAAAQKPTGKLGQDLQKQKAQSRKGTLEQLSADERRVRDRDAAANARAYN